MEIIQDKAIRLRLRNPDRITTVVPHSKKLGENDVLVRWGVEEARVLNNMGISVPSPIERRYSWPGKYTPFDHQRKTAAFLTLHTRCFCFSEQGCVDSETEYLSPTGWVKISEYNGGEVAQYHPESRTIEFVEPEEYVKLPCSDMIRIRTKYGLDQLLSPEHRVLIEAGKQSRDKKETLSAAELLRRHDAYHAGHRAKPGGTKAGTETIAFSGTTIPTAFSFGGGPGIEMSESELRLMVAVIADGHFPGNTDWCIVRLKKERKKERLRAILDSVGIEYVDKPCAPEGFTKLAFYAPLHKKEFDSYFWACSEEQLDVIADEVLHWDACTTRGERFSSASKASADFVQFVFASRGHTARVRSQVRHRRGRIETEYTVQIRRDTDRLFLRGSRETITRAPSSDGYKYCFRVPSTYLLFRRNGCIFASGNTGKSSAAVWAADYLMSQGLVSRVLILCPLSIMDAAWKNELFTSAMHRTVSICHGSPRKRREILDQGSEFVIINYDGIGTVHEELKNGGFDLIIVDEGTHLKNVKTRRWKLLNQLLMPDTRLWIMTGTPAAQSPMDAYGLAKLVNPNSVPKFQTAFRDRVMTQVTRFKWVPKEDASTVVHDVLQPAIRFTKEECMDLPDMVYTRRHAPMTAQQAKYYEDLRKHMIIQAAGEDVTAANAAVQMVKLLQIASGAVYTDDQEVLQFDIKSRYSALREVIDESSHKLIVFAPFRHAIDVLLEKLAADGIKAERIDGSVPAGRRAEIFRAFQDTPDPRVLVIQPQAAAHGVTLTAADTIVWWGPVSSLETYAQANARIHRAGQTNKCTVVQLYGSPVEERVYKMLDNKIDVHNQIVSLYKELLA